MQAKNVLVWKPTFLPPSFFLSQSPSLPPFLPSFLYFFCTQKFRTKSLASEIPCQPFSFNFLWLHPLWRFELFLWINLTRSGFFKSSLPSSLPFVVGESDIPPAKGNAMSGNSVGILLAFTQDSMIPPLPMWHLCRMMDQIFPSTAFSFIRKEPAWRVF